MHALKALAWTLLLVLPCSVVVAEAPPYRVIVNPNNVTTSIERKFLADAFLKKTTRWGNGDLIRPIDLVPDAAARRRFSDDVIKRSVEAVKSYWQQQLFSGRDVPPPELETDEEVVKYVLKNPGAVGYVSGTASVGGAKIVSIR